MIRLHNPHHLPFSRQTETFLRAGTLCDTVLSVEGHAFKVHALVLALASKSLERQLTSQSPGKGFHCTVDSVAPHTLKQILDYVYSEWVEIPAGDLPDLLRAAQHLEVQSLVEQCQGQMEVLEGVKNTQDVQVAPCESPPCQKIPSSNKKSLSSPLDSRPVTHTTDRQRSESLSSPNSLSPPPQKAPMPPTLLAPEVSREANRDAGASTTSLSQIPALRWGSMNPSRRMVLSYSDLMTVQALQASQHMLACSYPSSMYPFFHRTFPPHVPSSLVSYPGLLQPYHHLLHPGPLALEGPLVPSRGDRRKSETIGVTLAGTASHERKPKAQSEREMLCRHCSKTTADNSWRQTPRSEGSEEVCKFCKKSTKRSLRTIRRSLGGEKPYQCKHCSKRFSLKHQLDTHLRVHTGEKPFECRLCGQRSRDYSAMIKHLRTHGGATPYQCTLCLEFCSSLSTMQKHLKAHPTQDFPPNWSLTSTYLYTCHT